MSDGHKLAKLMREAGKQPQNEIVDIVTGEVTSVKPLRVRVENRELTESFLIVGALCQETRVKFVPDPPLESSDGLPSKIRLWRGLWAGDKVVMLKVGRGQKYYILQRVEGVI